MSGGICVHLGAITMVKHAKRRACNERWLQCSPDNACAEY
jgi:hypothetical protein